MDLHKQDTRSGGRESPDEQTPSTSAGTTYQGDRRSWATNLKDKVKLFCRRTIRKAANIGFHNFGLVTRPAFLHHYQKFTLDPDTAYPYIYLTGDDRTAITTNVMYPYPGKSDRFDFLPQVLCRESLGERCYYEVQWRGYEGVDVGLAYRSIEKVGWGTEILLGCNAKSWSLRVSPNECYYVHKNEKTILKALPPACSIGVYVDSRSGTLSFYSVSDKFTHIHTVQTKFTEPVYPAFYIGLNSGVKLLDLTFK